MHILKFIIYSLPADILIISKSLWFQILLLWVFLYMSAKENIQAFLQGISLELNTAYVALQLHLVLTNLISSLL